MNKGEPPSSSGSTRSLFLVGKNSRGNWVVQDQGGLRGGLFVDRAEALKFARSENGKNPHGVIVVPGVLELDMSQNSRNSADAQPALRRVA
ncbi:MAG TPA: hypothetical protein VKP67_23775 [Xanthobacteraceae bacterium]|nr:hypothetical protein [Xanthobacteraceae bacterium]